MHGQCYWASCHTNIQLSSLSLFLSLPFHVNDQISPLEVLNIQYTLVHPPPYLPQPKLAHKRFPTDLEG